MKYLFILGRNPKLSEAEILSYLEKEGIAVINLRFKSNALVIEVDKTLDVKRIINELGGVIAIGRVLLSGEAGVIAKEIRDKAIYFGRENKVIYSVLNYAEGEKFNEILDAIKANFREERLKARYKGVGGTIKLQGGDVVHGSPSKIMLRDMNYFLFGDKQLEFGVLEASYDAEEAEKKDMQKPYRRESLAISPRLARVLINLSQVKQKQTLLDPFCGVGAIAGEALLKGINVIGIDVDEYAAKNAKRNISWLRNQYKINADCDIINADSRKIEIKGFDGAATEPSLGELLRRVPTREKAEEMIFEFENLMIDVLNNIKKSLKKGGKIAFTAPLIKSQKGKVSCNIEEICDNTGLFVYKLKNSGIEFPIREFREDQIVGRDIFVLCD
jgi:tRNA G10  N-methylase Trm11